MAPNSFSFPKQLRLKSPIAVAAVFEKGRRFSGFPVMALVLWVPFDGQPLRVAVAVPKRRVRSAVDRNRQKRRLREAFRLHQNKFVPQPELTAHIVLMLVGDKNTTYQEIEKGFVKVLKKLQPFVVESSQPS
jgi:ribonuclease P protein component